MCKFNIEAIFGAYWKHLYSYQKEENLVISESDILSFVKLMTVQTVDSSLQSLHGVCLCMTDYEIGDCQFEVYVIDTGCEWNCV